MLEEIVSGSIILKKDREWSFKESYTLLSPDGQANVIVSSEPIGPDMDSDAYADIQGDLLQREFPGYEEYAFESMLLFGGYAGFMRKFKWIPPEKDPVTQIQIYYASGGKGYTATATTPSSQYERYADLLHQTLTALRIAVPQQPAVDGPSTVPALSRSQAKKELSSPRD
jgi:hypothetical protein